MNLVLVGYRGTGKSTIGKRVAEILKLDYVSLDAEIVRRAGMSIPEIVDQHSWGYFRDLEEEVTRDFSEKDHQVIDTGGGVVTRQANISRLRRSGYVFLLTAELEDILERITGDKERPSLTEAQSLREEVIQVLEERAPLYEAAAHSRVNTSVLSAEEAAKWISKTFLSLDSAG